MGPSENKKFTAADIARYHTGKMPAEERHALEKAALDDPFLADALEGYVVDPAPAAAIAELQKRLDEKIHPQRPARVIALYRALSAVAMLIVLAGTGWFAWKAFEDTKQTRSVARQEKQAGQKPITVTTPFDSLRGNPSPAVAGNAEPDSQANTNSEEIVAAGEDLQEKPAEKATSASQLPSTTIAAQDLNANDFDTLSMAASGKPETTMLLKAPADERMRKVQAFEQAKDSAAEMNSIAGRSRAQNDTISNFDVTLKAQKMEVPEVVVVGDNGEVEASARYPHVTIDTLEPAEGYTNFDDYVAQNLKMPGELRDKSMSGEVQLSFDVDENGQPVNITVVKSLCSKCDEEAIRLLKDGPKWKKKKNKKGKITIHF